MPNLSRRHLVTAAAALPALALPAAAAPTHEPDPVFAAIEKWRTLAALHGEAIDAVGAYETSHEFRDTDEFLELDERSEMACHAECDAVRELCLTVPTTLAGAVAVLRLVEEVDGYVFMIYMSDDDEDAAYRDKGHQVLMRSLRKAMERWAAGAVVRS